MAKKKAVKPEKKERKAIGALNKPGREDWIAESHTFAAVADSIDDLKLMDRYYYSYLKDLQYFTNLGAECLSLGAKLSFTKDGRFGVKLDFPRAKQFMALVAPGKAVINGKSFYALRNLWVLLNEERAEDKKYGFRFQTFVWDELSKKVDELLKATVVKHRVKGESELPPLSMGRIRDRVAAGRMPPPEIKKINLPLPMYESSTPKVRFEVEEGVDKKEELVFYIRLEPGREVRLIAHGWWKRLETATGVNADGEQVEIDTEVWKPKKLDVNSRRVFHKLRNREYVPTLGGAWLNKKGQLRIKFSYVRPPKSRLTKKDSRYAEVFFELKEGVDEDAGKQFYIHTAVDSMSGDKVDKYHTFSIPINEACSRLDTIQAQMNKRQMRLRTHTRRRGVQVGALREKINVCADRRDEVVKNICGQWAGKIVGRLMQWHCAHLTVYGLPLGEGLLGDHKFQWSTFLARLQHKCAKHTINLRDSHDILKQVDDFYNEKIGKARKKKLSKAKKEALVEDLRAKRKEEKERLKQDWAKRVAKLSTAVTKAIEAPQEPEDKPEETIRVVKQERRSKKNGKNKTRRRAPATRAKMSAG